MKQAILACALGTALLAGPQAAAWANAADQYPNKPITMYVSFPPGGIIDIQARTISQKLSEKWNVPVVVQNAPGAGGNLGTAMAFKGDSEGYTLLATTPGPMAINQYLFKNPGYEPEKFVPVSLMTHFSNALVVRGDLPAANLAEFLDYARARPGEVTYASQGNGTTSHLSAELMAKLAGLKFIHVPYKGEGPAMIDVSGGRVDMFIGNLASVIKQVEGGKVRMLAVASDKRAPISPDTPTAIEAGLPGFVVTAWYGIVAAPGTPPAVADKLSAAINEILEMPDVRQRFTSLGADVVGSTPKEFSDWIADERVRWKGVIEEANISLD